MISLIFPNPNMKKCGGIFDKNKIRESISKLQLKTTQPNFWDNNQSAQKILKNISLFENELTMWKDHRCSLQLHNYKKETIYVLSGQLRIISGSDQDNLTDRIYTAGETVTISPGTVHRMEGEEDSVYLEASTPEMDDVVRLVDDYERA